MTYRAYDFGIKFMVFGGLVDCLLAIVWLAR